MADRTWNKVSVGLFEEEWSNGAILIGVVLKGQCKNRYGVFKTPRKFLKGMFGEWMSEEEIEVYIAELEQVRFLEKHLNQNGEELVWIIDHFQNDNLQTTFKVKNLIGLYKEVREYPASLRNRFVEQYADHFHEGRVRKIMDFLGDKSEDKRQTISMLLYDVFTFNEKIRESIRHALHDVEHNDERDSSHPHLSSESFQDHLFSDSSKERQRKGKTRVIGKILDEGLK